MSARCSIFQAKLALTLVGSVVAINAAYAGDLGFRFDGKSCVDKNSKVGLNPSYFGQCGDLRHVTVEGLSLDGTDLSGSVFDGANFETCSLNNTNLSSVSFKGTNLTGASMTGATIHKANFNSATLRNVHFSGSDIQDSNFNGADLTGDLFSTMSLNTNTFAGANLTGAALDGTTLSGIDFTKANFSQCNLQGANLDNAILKSAILSGADLTKASLQGVHASAAHFVGSILRQSNLQGAKLDGADLHTAKLDSAVLKGANLQNADLRRAAFSGDSFDSVTVNNAQFNHLTILPITAAAAVALGMIDNETASLLIIADQDDGSLGAFIGAVQAAGLQVTVAVEDTTKFKGDLDLSSYTSILHLSGNDESVDMPTAGQTALVSFVQAGGTYINAGIDSVLAMQKLYQNSLDLLLLTAQSNQQGTLTISPVPAQATHPIFNGLQMPLTTGNFGYLQCTQTAFASNPSTVIMTDSGGNPVIVVRNLGTGHVVSFTFGTNQDNSFLMDSTFQKLFVNAAGIW